MARQRKREWFRRRRTSRTRSRNGSRLVADFDTSVPPVVAGRVVGLAGDSLSCQQCLLACRAVAQVLLLDVVHEVKVGLWPPLGVASCWEMPGGSTHRGGPSDEGTGAARYHGTFTRQVQKCGWGQHGYHTTTPL